MVGRMIEVGEHALVLAAWPSRADLDTDLMLRPALARAREIVGEAAGPASEAGRAEPAAVPWTQIVGRRTRLVHARSDLSRGIPWDTVQLSVHALLAQLEPASATH